MILINVRNNVTWLVRVRHLLPLVPPSWAHGNKHSLTHRMRTTTISDFRTPYGVTTYRAYAI